MHVYVQQFPWFTDTFLKACSWDTYRWTRRRAWVSPNSLGDKHVTFWHNGCMPPSRPRLWYGQFCSICHLLSTDGGIQIARHIVWTISTGWAVDCGVITVWNTPKICRRECGRHGYHPLLPSLTNRMRETTINLRSKEYIINNIIWCDLVLFLLCLGW